MTMDENVTWLSPAAKAVFEQWQELRDNEAEKYQRRAERMRDPRQLYELQQEMHLALEQFNKVLVKLYMDYTLPPPIRVEPDQFRGTLWRQQGPL